MFLVEVLRFTQEGGSSPEYSIGSSLLLVQRSRSATALSLLPAHI